MRDYRLKPPLFETDGDWFSIIFRRKRLHDTIERTISKDGGFIPTDIGISEGIDEGIKILLEFIEKSPGLRAPQISKALGVPVKTLERWVRHLKVRNQIEFRGSRRFGGYWKKVRLDEGVSEGIDEGIRTLLEFIEKNPGLRAPQISKVSGVPVKTLERWIRHLKAKNQIEFRGSRRFGGYWPV